MKAKYSEITPVSEAEIDRVFEVIQSNPNCNTKVIESATGLGFRKILTATNRLISTGRITKRSNATRRVFFLALEQPK